jgi:hypothetical protein
MARELLDRRHRFLMRAAVAVLLALAVPAAAAAREISVPWHDLRSFIQDRKVTVTAGRVISGRVLSISDDALTVRSGKQTESIARANVTSIKVTRYDGSARKIGLGIGFVVGLVVGLIALLFVGLNETTQDSRAVRKAKTIAAWLSTWGGITLGGWLIGRLIDREVLVIRPIPAAPPPARQARFAS